MRGEEFMEGHTSTKFYQTKYSFHYFQELKLYFNKILLNHSQQSWKENQGISCDLVVYLNFMPISGIL